MRYLYLFGIFLSLPFLSFSEGMKQLFPDSIYYTAVNIQSGPGPSSCFGMESCDADHKLYVHIDHLGEKIFLGIGFSVLGDQVNVKLKNNFLVFGPVTVSSNGSPGFINFFSQGYFGPDVLGPAGYQPLSFTPLLTGDYEIDFVNPLLPSSNIYLSKIDVTVIDTTITPYTQINGRLWAKKWIFNSSSVDIKTNAFLGTMHIYTEDSVVTSIYFNSMQGHYFEVACNANGCFPPPEPWDSSCRSRPDEHVYPQFKIFVADPDSICYPTGTMGQIDENTLTVTPFCNGSFLIHFYVGKPGKINAVFDINPLPGIQLEDVVIMEEVSAGWNDLFWNGLDGQGQPVAGGTQISLTLTFVNGLTNLPIYDVEKQVRGFVVTQVRPPAQAIATYWNDTLLANKGGVLQLTGCYSHDTVGCHCWNGYYLGVGLGSENTVNTWWYATNNTAVPIILTVQRPPDKPENISGPLSFCQSAVNTYTVVPNPLPGADPGRYEWVLTEDATGLAVMNLTNQGPSVTIAFSLYPAGNQHLKVRGENLLCGNGPYGPGISNEGIPLQVNTSPFITNTVTAFSICSGNSIDINLQSTLPLTTYSYTAVATSGFVSGYSGGTSNPIQQTLLNTGTEVDSVIYRVVPLALSCPGDTVSFFVAVTPVPQITNVVTSFQVCSGIQTNIQLTSDIPTATFTWTATGSDPSVTGYFDAGGPLIAQTLVNTGFVDQTVTYTVIPTLNGCNGTPKVFTVTVSPNKPVSISISPSDNPVCENNAVNFSSTYLNQGLAPVFQWKINGTDAGTNSPTFNYIPADGDNVQCILISSEITCVSNNPAFSNNIVMIVDPVLAVSISISASSNPFCVGTPVTFTATSTHAGFTPSYQWKVNGINAGTNSNIFTYNPVNNDQVYCILTSSEPCTSNNPASSIIITMVENNNLPAGVSISATSNPFCPGSSVTFTAIPSNGGTPVYQWKVNGINVGTNSITYSYNPVNNDSIRCIMTSNLACVTGNPASSNKIIMSGTLAPIVTFTSCFDTITTTNAKPIKLKGGIPLGGTYSGTGVSAGYYYPNIAGTGTHVITYSYTNVSLCTASKNSRIHQFASSPVNCGSPITDIRDNKIYQTVQIGIQCWLATNLNFGNTIASTQDQRDNCIAEKYCYNDNPMNCTNHGGLYQWDEVMRFDESPADQGFCPPGWHIPTENDWNTLFASFINNGFAGSPLKYSGYSGFNALLSGARHINRGWDFQGFAMFFWSSTPLGSTKAWAHGMNDPDPSVSFYPSSRVNAFSVRCLKD